MQKKRAKGQAPKTKQQLIAELKQNQDFQKKMKFAREVFYPALLKASPTVEDATMWLTGFNSAVMQQFLERMKDVKIKDLNLGLKLDAMSDKFVEFQNILAIFDDMSVFEAKDHIEGLKGEIDVWKSDEDRTRLLSDLKVRWMDEL